MMWIRLDDNLIQITKKIKDIEVRSITNKNKEIDGRPGHKLVIYYVNGSITEYDFKNRIDAINCLNNIQEVLKDKNKDGVFKVSG